MPGDAHEPIRREFFRPRPKLASGMIGSQQAAASSSSISPNSSRSSGALLPFLFWGRVPLLK